MKEITPIFRNFNKVVALKTDLIQKQKLNYWELNVSQIQRKKSVRKSI